MSSICLRQFAARITSPRRRKAPGSFRGPSLSVPGRSLRIFGRKSRAADDIFEEVGHILGTEAFFETFGHDGPWLRVHGRDVDARQNDFGSAELLERDRLLVFVAGAARPNLAGLRQHHLSRSAGTKIGMGLDDRL